MTPNGREIIRSGYASGVKVSEIARQCESTPNSVKVIAHRMGLRHRRHVDMRVPADKQADYRLFVRFKNCSAAYATKVLGLEAGV